MGSSGNGDSFPAAYASYNTPNSRTNTPTDHPSLTMWCTVNSNTCSSSPSRSSFPLNNGPRPKSNGILASSIASRKVSRSLSSTPLNSITGNSTSTRSPTTCIARPSTSTNLVRSASCRRTISCRLLRSASSFSRPFSFTDPYTLYAGLSVSNCCKNHKRCCANDSAAFCRPSRCGMPPSTAASASFFFIRRSSSVRFAGDNPSTFFVISSVWVS